MAPVLAQAEDLSGDTVAVTAVSACTAEATVSTEQNEASAPQDHTTETTAVPGSLHRSSLTDPDCTLTSKVPGRKKTINSDWN